MTALERKGQKPGRMPTEGKLVEQDGKVVLCWKTMPSIKRPGRKDVVLIKPLRDSPHNIYMAVSEAHGRKQITKILADNPRFRSIGKES